MARSGAGARMALAAAGGLGPQRLWRYDAVTEPTLALAGVTSLNGLTIAEATQGSPTTWESTQGRGIQAAKTGGGVQGRIYTTTTNINVLMQARYGRNLLPEDALVWSLQHSVDQPTVNDSFAAAVAYPAADNHDCIVRSGRMATSKYRRTIYYDGTNLSTGYDDGVARARTITIRLNPGGHGALIGFSDSVLNGAYPLRDGVILGMRSNGSGLSSPSRHYTGYGGWAMSEDPTFRLQLELRVAALEAAPQAIEAAELWVQLGAPPA